jgi:hypothetical protein
LLCEKQNILSGFSCNFSAYKTATLQSKPPLKEKNVLCRVHYLFHIPAQQILKISSMVLIASSLLPENRSDSTLKYCSSFIDKFSASTFIYDAS